MLGRAAGRHGSCCGGPPGPDCVDHYKGKKAQRAHERRQWQREEEMEWRSVKRININVDPELASELGADNWAVEAALDGAWIRVRVQKDENGEISEYAVPAERVTAVSFWPTEPAQS